MKQVIRLYYPNIDDRTLDPVLDYSINKRYKSHNVTIDNSYTKKQANMTLLEVADYINDRQPIVTAFGTMFKRHGTVPNPLAKVIQLFLDKRTEDKNMMFKFPKGSEEYEKYNLLQQLDKIDANGIYGLLGLCNALVYNVNVATSITSHGRALVSSMALFFESFLANNVKFGSLNEVMEFINHVVEDKKFRKYDDFSVLNKENQYISSEDCFAKVVLTCGFRWIPNEDELEVIWRTICNLNTEDRNRVYYKNNLYEFLDNDNVFSLIMDMLHKLEKPMLEPTAPKEIDKDLKLFCDLLKEYVYYRFPIIDRTDKYPHMIRSVTTVSDTDSTIISVDAFYRYVATKISGDRFRIASSCLDPVMFSKKDEWGDWIDGDEWKNPVEWVPKKYDYRFDTDKVLEIKHMSEPCILQAEDNMRFSIINILAYVLGELVNDYMDEVCKHNFSSVPTEDDWERKTPEIYIPKKFNLQFIRTGIEERNELPEECVRKHTFTMPCKIFAKTEFLMRRLMMTQAKKNYASLIEVQEGNMVPENQQLDVKGIEALLKSTKPKSTRNALKKILLEDVLKAPAIDQIKFLKDIAILEHTIVDSIKSGSKEYFKPATIKSMNAYTDPMRIQGIKASIAWNKIKDSSYPAINLEERNGVNIVKVIIDETTIDQIKDQYPEVYENIKKLLYDENFGYSYNEKRNKEKLGSITAVALPLDTQLPEWLEPFVDYISIVNDNIGGFPYESIGIAKFDKGSGINYTNVVEI